MLQMHLIDPEWLATVIDRTTTRTIGVRQRITLREKITFLIQRTERFITDFVIEEHELAEVGSSSIVDVHLPTTLHFLVGATTQRVEILRPFRLHNKGAKEAHYGQFTVMAVRVKLPYAFLHVGMDIPLELLRLARRHDRVGIGGRRRLARRTDDHAGSLYEQAPILTFHLVSKRHLDAVALIGPEDQRLDHVALKTRRDRTRIEAFLVTRFLVLRFLGTRFSDIFGVHIHVPRIEIEPTVQRDFDVDHRHVVGLGWDAGRTLPP